MSTQAQFFDSMADQWDAMECSDIEERVGRVVREAGISPNMEILDVGTGTGVLIGPLLKAMHGTGQIRAIDISQGMLAVAARKSFPQNVQFELADVATFACHEQSFDRVMCNAVFPHFERPSDTLARLWGLLKQGGRIVISHPIGREAVNRIHRGTDAVADDIVPEPNAMTALLSDSGFTQIDVIDEPEFYLAIGSRPQAQG